jgi:sortase A
VEEMLLLKVGVASMLLALALAAATAAVVNLPGDEEPAGPPVASAEPQAAETPAEETEPDTDVKPEAAGEPRGREPQKDAGTPAEPEERDLPRLSSPQVEPKPREAGPYEEPREQPQREALPVPPEDRTPLTPEEVAAADGPRYYPPQPDAELTLTVEAMGIHDAPVLNSTSPEALASGVVHIPETPMPWDERPQKNVYLAAHRVGSPGTTSRTIFYNLDKLTEGDSVVLKDRSGNTYGYRVSEVFVVEPDAGWVLDPVRDRDMLTLQTCTYPTFENRLIVRADRV